jgi:ribosomal protein S18 acetylase RimI-like enzyme
VPPYRIDRVRPEDGERCRAIRLEMLDAVTAWARGTAQVPRLLLDVHESNARAIAFYERRGFVRTGHTAPYPLDLTADELEMQLVLG